MNIFRVVVATLPQVLVLLLLGGWLDLLGGFNHTDAGFGVLMVLFIFNPIVTLILLIAETVKRRQSAKTNVGNGSINWHGFSLLLFGEALITNLFILSQLQM